MKSWLAIGGMVWLLGAVPSFSQEHIFDFDHDKAGEPPQGWISDGEPWRIMNEPQAPSKPNVLVAPRSVLGGGSAAHLFVSSAPFTTGDLGVRFRTTREDPPAVFALVWGLDKNGNYEELEVNTQTNTVSLVTAHEGKIHLVRQESLMFTPNTWHLLQVQVLPKQRIVYVDNEMVVTGSGALIKNPGQIGLSMIASSPLQLDDFAWRNR